ncbi:MAG: endonuclease/exonuclease/phosphatase family protein [Candidatus Thorarchaeota archaeon]|nr:MAG: endonuclease/exonuclease/phosphatase family protein [Candidatus Thorarchaeota archaeon]
MSSTNTFRITVFLSIIFLLGSMIGLVQTLPPTPDTTPTQPLALMTYNIYQGYTPEGAINLEAIRDTIVAGNADIIGLQECDTTRISSMNIDTILWLANELNMYSYYGPPSSEQIIGVALLSKYPIANATYHLLSHEELPRVLIEATVEVGATQLTVFVVHLGLSYVDRTTQAEEVMGIVNAAPFPKVLMGDFNTQPTGEPEPGVVSENDTIYEDISEHLNDTWTAAGNVLNPPEGFTWPSIGPYERIDYIWVSPDINVVSCWVISSALGSDHLPVVSTVELP